MKGGGEEGKKEGEGGEVSCCLFLLLLRIGRGMGGGEKEKRGGGRKEDVISHFLPKGVSQRGREKEIGGGLIFSLLRLNPTENWKTGGGKKEYKSDRALS